MTSNLADRFAELPQLLAGHLLLSVSALVVGIAISVPLGIAATRHPRLRGPALTLAGLIQTVPSMALLALMVPLLGGMIGFVPAFIALTLYSVLPVLRNTVTGILEIDPALTEAARGVGMTDRQSLWWVELPLAAPIITAYSTDGRIAAFELVVLSDPKQAFPTYDAILLLSPRAAKNPQLVQSLIPLVNAVTDTMMRSANMAVDIDGLSVENSARLLYRRIAGRNGGSR